MASHPFLNIWLVVANLFAAYGLWRLWNLKTVPILGPLAATTLAASIVAGGIIDLVPIRNSSYVELNYEKDDLVRWLCKNTRPNDIFLTDRFLTHPILLAGRRIFLAGRTAPGEQDTIFAEREPIYRQMFESKNPMRVHQLLKDDHIEYVAFDDGVRHGELIKKPNEQVYTRYFQKAYEDKENRYRKLVIYKVPDSLPATVPNHGLIRAAGDGLPRGTWALGKVSLTMPRAIAIDNCRKHLCRRYR